MKKLIPSLLFLALTLSASAQKNGFDFGKISPAYFKNTYAPDTTVGVLVLNEYGESYMSDEDFDLHFHYHVVMLVLNKKGLSAANYEIPLRKNDKVREEVLNIRASSFSINEHGLIKESALKFANVFTKEVHRYRSVTTFPIPDVRVGSIIEISYDLQSPFIEKFRGWEFQGEYPKLRSEYWATIPGNYNYNIVLKGFLKLQKNEQELLRGCFSPGGGNSADCSRMKYAMTNIPPFVEEEYMISKSNYLSSINYELSHIQYFDGRVVKFTKEWKDAEQELNKESSFGGQFRKGKDIMADHLGAVVGAESDPLAKAKKIFYFIRDRFEWNEVYGYSCESGIKKAFESKTGNVGDINISLIAALRYAGLDVEPVILSTRGNGTPIELHPVLTDYNYVVAKINVGDKYFFADATDDFVSFGMLPLRCLNGKGRALGKDGSYFVPLTVDAVSKTLDFYDLELFPNGSIKGNGVLKYEGYASVDQRKIIGGFDTQQDYKNNFANNLLEGKIDSHELEGFDLVEGPLLEKLSLTAGELSEDQKLLLFNPFLHKKLENNPFRMDKRQYPVDFGILVNEAVAVKLKLPENATLENPPKTVAVALPNNGGKLLYEVKQIGQEIQINYQLAIFKAVIPATEYAALKELMTLAVDIQRTDLVIKRQ